MTLDLVAMFLLGMSGGGLLLLALCSARQLDSSDCSCFSGGSPGFEVLVVVSVCYILAERGGGWTEPIMYRCAKVNNLRYR